jgi:selenocysteine lyase/cysteine desulfurase
VTANGFSLAELDRLRGETPAWGRYAHFAHGSASLPPASVFDAQENWIEAERRLGSHRAADHHGEALADVKASVARLVNAQPYRIALLDSASRSWSTAMSAVINRDRPVHVIATDLEYGANAIYLLLAAKRNRLTFSVLPTRAATMPLSQQVTQALDRVPRHRTPVVALALVSAAWGIESVNGDTARDIARQVRERDGFFFLDASHAVGQLPVDMSALACDAMVFPSRKWLRGPKGVGVLCLSDRALTQFGSADSTDVAAARWSSAVKAQPHADARRFEGYEFNPGLRLALKAACDYALATGLDRIAAQNRQVRAALVSTLCDRLGWRSLEGDANDATALTTYHLPLAEGSIGMLVEQLWRAGVNVSDVTSQHALWALEPLGTQALLRLTPHYLTDQSEIERLASALDSAARQT